MNKKLFTIGAVCILVALAAAFYFSAQWRRSDAQGVSAQGIVDAPVAARTPAAAKSDPAAVISQANVGGDSVGVRSDEQGSVESFRALQRCTYASRDLVNASKIADCSFYEGKPQYQTALGECLNGQMDARNRIAAAKAILSHCDETNLGTRYFQAVKEAAARGNPDAQLCYLQGDFFSPEGAQIFTDAELQEYKNVAPQYVEAALKRGDWRIVSLLNTRHLHSEGSPVYLLDGIGDRATRYRMTKLMRLGASGDFAKVLDGQLQDMKHPDLDPSAALAPKVTNDGDDWAQETFTKYFSGRTGLSEEPEICGA